MTEALKLGSVPVTAGLIASPPPPTMKPLKVTAAIVFLKLWGSVRHQFYSLAIDGAGAHTAIGLVPYFTEARVSQFLGFRSQMNHLPSISGGSRSSDSGY